MYSVIRENKQKDYIYLWHTKYWKEIEDEYKGNPRNWEIFNGHVKKNEDFRLMAKIRYGNYVIVQILIIWDHESDYTKTIALLEEDGRYWLTNDLSKDWIFLYLSQVEARRYEKDYKRKQICTP